MQVVARGRGGDGGSGKGGRRSGGGGGDGGGVCVRVRVSGHDLHELTVRHAVTAVGKQGWVGLG